MLAKEKLTILFSFILLFLTGCTTLKAVATSESSLLTPTSTLASATSTPICVNEPDVKPYNFATLEFPDSLTEIDGGRESPSPWGSPQIKNGLTFYIRGIYAINKDIAFIFGGLSVPGGTIGSLLLRSTDGGIHWKEALNPINYNDITHVVFIGNGEGWAISTWTPEGDAGTRLWHTTDFGETWQENKGHPPTTIGIRVFDGKHMQVQSLNWWANPNTDRYMIWDSYDGGTTWAESFSVPVKDTNVESVAEAYADTPGGRYGNYFQCDVWKTACTAYGQDGSKWQIQDVYEKTCISETGSEYHGKLIYAEVSHLWLEKETTFAIPVYFYYQDNKIRVKP
jgi:hypothetical protein